MYIRLISIMLLSIFTWQLIYVINAINLFPRSAYINLRFW